jgi:putative FmdB family regulatory protein
MPLYDYRCKTCGNEIEVTQAYSDAPLKVCSVCGGELRRVISKSTGVIFRGSGFYVTDNRGNNPAAPKSTTNGSAKEGSATTSSAGSSSAPSVAAAAD